MNWIETLFGVNPDGGSGITEAVYVIATGGVAALTYAARRRLARRRTLSGLRASRSVENVLETLGRHPGERLDG